MKQKNKQKNKPLIASSFTHVGLMLEPMRNRRGRTRTIEFFRKGDQARKTAEKNFLELLKKVDNDRRSGN